MVSSEGDAKFLDAAVALPISLARDVLLEVHQHVPNVLSPRNRRTIGTKGLVILAENESRSLVHVRERNCAKHRVRLTICERCVQAETVTTLAIGRRRDDEIYRITNGRR